MIIELADFSRSRHGLFFHYRVGEHRFNNSFWYDDCDFDDLERRYGLPFMRRVYFHVAAFEMNKLSSVNADEISFGPFNDLADAQFRDLWTQIVHGVWAQWRYENGLPNWAPPTFAFEDTASTDLPTARIAPGDTRYLAFCGGGKDSAVAQSLLSDANVHSDSFVYAHSVYGRAEKQFELIDRLLSQMPDGVQRRLTVCDDFLEAPASLLREEFGVKSFTAAETPASIFAAVPIALQHGYEYLVLGHEKSADKGNLIWGDTEEDVNHQWGKSTEAESILADYLRDNLVPNLHFFSILKPIHDVVIFGMLKGLSDPIIEATHSCNIDKPWCKRCAKCVYVWLNYLAYLDDELVARIFGENLFDVAENQDLIRELIGLTEATPFECIGESNESLLALALCVARGREGRFLPSLRDHVPADLSSIVAQYTSVDMSYANLPEDLKGVMDNLVRKAAEIRSWISSTLSA